MDSMSYPALKKFLDLLDDTETLNSTFKAVELHAHLKQSADIWHDVQDELVRLCPSFKFDKYWKRVCIQLFSKYIYTCARTRVPKTDPKLLQLRDAVQNQFTNQIDNQCLDEQVAIYAPRDSISNAYEQDDIPPPPALSGVKIPMGTSERVLPGTGGPTAVALPDSQSKEPLTPQATDKIIHLVLCDQPFTTSLAAWCSDGIPFQT
jgi:hypothetical protein